MNDSSIIKICNFLIDYREPSVLLETNWITLIILVALVVLGVLLKRRLKQMKYSIPEIEFGFSPTPNVKFKIRRDDTTIFIANRIYIELVTRKAAIPFKEGEDVIVEVYDSWYKLFNLIRDEIEAVPGEYLRDHDSTSALIGLTIEILNTAMRPHLTKYQARFRRWYAKELEKPGSIDSTPQEIRCKKLLTKVLN